MELVGRERELEELLDRVGRHRLVTVTGPGGIGKTALAEHAVARAAHRFARGAFQVDLTRIDSPDAVGGALAAQLGFSSFDALINSPTDSAALLLLDNCEHVVDAAAEAVARLLDACRAPRVLTTSRVALDLPGESLVVLGPLGEAAVTLFLERARDAGAKVRDDDLPTVELLCRALDGLPLALELAAARLRTLTPAEVLARLDDLETLSRPRFRGPSRHGDLRTTMTWSYDLLDERRRQAFDRLGVFSGPFTAELAHAVTGVPDTPASVTLADLDELVAASLLATQRDGTTTKYRMLLTVRALARDHLAERDELEPLGCRLADAVLADALAVEARLMERWDPDVLPTLLGMFEHLASALRWSLARGDRDRCLSLVGVLWGVARQAHAAEIGALGEEVLRQWPDAGGDVRDRALATVVTCRFFSGEPRGALDLALAAAPVPTGHAAARLELVVGQARVVLGDESGALEALERGAELAAGVRSWPLARELQTNAAQVRATLGDTARAVTALQQVRTSARSGGSVVDALLARVVEADVRLEAEPDAAAELAVELAVLADAAGLQDLADLARGVQWLAVGIRGDAVAAARGLHALLDSLWLRGALAQLRPALHAAASVLHSAGHAAAADLAASADELVAVAVIARPGRERCGFDHARGIALEPPAAVDLAGRALAEVAEAGVAPTAPRAGEFVRDGDGWQLVFAGRTARLRDSKGMADLARLVAVPDGEVHCLDLFGAELVEGSAGELVDAEARARYEQRLRDLQEEITAAEDDHDLARSERAQLEFDQILEHLSSALGLAGRPRRGPGTSERARSAVTQRIRGTIRRIAEVHPELGRHLQVSVRTGTWCCYGPDQEVRWQIGPPG